MRAMAAVPGDPTTARVIEVEEPLGDGDVVVEGIAVGICGTDTEIVSGGHGSVPPGEQHLVLGHESLGRVVSAPEGSGLGTGDLVVGIVRRPDPVPCEACAAGASDMCRNGLYTEHGIKELHGFGAQQWRSSAQYLVPIDDALGMSGVLLEPASVVAKAWHHIEHIAARGPVAPRSVLVTGAGPVGLLAALLAVQRELEVHVLDRHDDGPKPDLVAALGASYHAGDLMDVPETDVVLECTGAPAVIAEVLTHHGPAAVVCLLGVSGSGTTTPLDLGAVNRRLVLENDVVFGSVNANRSHYEIAAAALAAADRSWLDRLITRRVPLETWPEALERRSDDVKVIVDLGAAAPDAVGDACA